jgi:eukaryotic-like serine/threonine-protein kinase
MTAATCCSWVATGQAIDRWDRAQVVGQSAGSKERRVILEGGSEAHYVATGHLLYMIGGTLYASPFDVGALQLRGGPTPIVQGVRRFTANAQSPGASFTFSAGGTFAYIPGPASGVAQQTLALASRDGTLQPLDLPAQAYFFPRVSPDGEKLAVQIDDGREAFISIYDLKGGGNPRRLTFGGRDLFPLWTRDGRRIAFQSDREGDRGLFWQLADGTAPAERLVKSDALSELRPEAWSADGKTLTLSMYPPMDYRLFTLAADGAGVLKPLSSLPARSSTLSPDGKWFAYASTEIGNRAEIFVQPFPPTGSKYQVSTEGGRFPLWLPDGKQLAYHANLTQRFLVVDVRTQPTFDPGRSVELPIDAIFFGNARNFDVTPDGTQFVVVRPAAASADYDRSATQQINVVLNWFDDLKAKVPKK